MKTVCDRFLAIAFLSPGYPGAGGGETEGVEYRHGDAVLEGFLAYDDSFQGKRPGSWWPRMVRSHPVRSGSGRSSWPAWGTSPLRRTYTGKASWAKDAKGRCARGNLHGKPEADAGPRRGGP